MSRPTGGTGPGPDRQGQCIQHMPARRASFARWEKPIDSDHGLSVPGRLVFEQSDGGTDRGITQHAGDGVVLDHPLEIEVFDVERIEAFDEYSGQFLERVVSGVTNPLIDHGEAMLCVLSSSAAALGATEPLLENPECALLSFGMAWVVNRFPSAECGQVRDTEINAHRLAGLGPRDRGHVDHQRDKVFAGGRLDDPH